MALKSIKVPLLVFLIFVGILHQFPTVSSRNVQYLTPGPPLDELSEEDGSGWISTSGSTDDDDDDLSDLEICGRPLSMVNARIVGGEEAEGAGDWPWQAMLSEQDSWGWKKTFTCGGSLINNKWVITAAHCTVGVRPKKLFVTLGEHNRKRNEGSEKEHRVEKIVDHPDYDHGTLQNDISLLKLARSVDYTDHIRPICLPEHNYDVTVGEMCAVTGWGDTKNNKESQHILREARVPIIDQKLCNRWLNGQVFHNNVCAGFQEGGVDTCQGDSGGPLACPRGNNYYLEGVVSWGDGCAQKMKPGVFTRVADYIKWIEETVNE